MDEHRDWKNSAIGLKTQSCKSPGDMWKFMNLAGRTEGVLITYRKEVRPKT